MNHLLISKQDAEEFLNFVRSAIDENRIVKPYNELKNALVFSFDADLNAFSNYTKGWHKYRELRPYLEKRLSLVEKLEAMMSHHRQSGGRVFVDIAYAYIVDRQSNRTDLCKLTWPEGSNVVDEIRLYWNERHRPKPIRLSLARGA